MADNVTVSNAPTSVNADIPVRTIDKAGEQTQVVAVDWGGAGGCGALDGGCTAAEQ